MARSRTVRLAGVRKSYRGRGEVLAGIDMEVGPGQPVAVLGGNGSGKSTLLRIVAGCAAPTAGAVRGRPPVVGYVPGRVPASARLSVRSYLRHMAALHGAPRAAAADRAATVLEDLLFTGALDAPVALLSTGNAQKVALAQALSCDADMLVLDEPWSGLDAPAAAVLDRILAAASDTIALLVTDHSGRAASLHGVRVLRLADGVLTPESPPESSPWRAGFTVVELRCPGDPAAAPRVLPAVEDSWIGPGSLTVRVPADRGDSLLAAALAGGFSVAGVWREEAQT